MGPRCALLLLALEVRVCDLAADPPIPDGRVPLETQATWPRTQGLSGLERSGDTAPAQARGMHQEIMLGYAARQGRGVVAALGL